MRRRKSSNKNWAKAPREHGRNYPGSRDSEGKFYMTPMQMPELRGRRFKKAK